MKNSRQSIIKFRQYLIFAIKEVAGASLKPDNSKDQGNYDLLFATDDMQDNGNVRGNFKNRLENYLEIVRIRSTMLQGEPDSADLEKVRTDAAVDLSNSLDDLWRSFIS
jgi:hypothetical protein